MDTLALKLPGHLYTEPVDSDGTEHEVILDAERIVAWYDNGNGVHKLCSRLFEQELHTIEHWEENQSLLLDEQWMSLENAEDDEENEAQYDLACEALASEARDKRKAAHARRNARESTLAKLVQESIDHIEAHRPVTASAGSGGFLLLLAVGAVLGFALMGCT